MKRIAALITVIVLCISSAALAADWSCPKCGTLNYGNYCTECGRAAPASGWDCPYCGTHNGGNFCSECGRARPASNTNNSNNTSDNGTWLWSIDRVPTRTGPGTKYSEPGSFYEAGVRYKVISRSDIWLQIEVEYNGMLARVYTGKKRFNPTSAQLAKIPQEQRLYSGRMNRDYSPQAGPGTEYTYLHKGSLDKDAAVYLYKNDKVSVFAEENGYVQIEFTIGKTVYRGWVPEWTVN